MPSPGPGGSQSSLAGMVVSWLTSQFRTGRSSRKLAMRLDGKREPGYHVERADAAAAWRRHFHTAAFLLERGIVPANLTPSLSEERQVSPTLVPCPADSEIGDDRAEAVLLYMLV